MHSSLNVGADTAQYVQRLPSRIKIKPCFRKLFILKHYPWLYQLTFLNKIDVLEAVKLK